jgi:hypothetical protein
MTMRILLGQLGSNGDCLYATTVARQIKQDFPGCHLTWAVSSLARSVLTNNPDIDEIWEIPTRSWDDLFSTSLIFEREALRLHAAGVYDHVFVTQIAPGRFHNYDGTIRPSIFRNYGRPITVPIESIINLTEEEIERVNLWHASTAASDADFSILFECSSKSGQSFMTPDRAMHVAERVIAEFKDAAVLISTHEAIKTNHPRILGVGALSMRENARLTHFMDLFVGCGSGLTVVATSDAANPTLPTIQVLKRDTSVYASFRHDFEYFGKPTDRFMEITNEDPNALADAVLHVAREGFEAGKARHDDPVPLSFGWYFYSLDCHLLARGAYADAASSLLVTAERYGPDPDLRQFAARDVAPFLKHDRHSNFPQRAAELARFHQIFDL